METNRDHHAPGGSPPATPSAVIMGVSGPYGPVPLPTPQSNASMSPAPVMHGMPLPFNQMGPPPAAVTKPMEFTPGSFYHGQSAVSSGGGGGGTVDSSGAGSTEQVKKKRGRPRKYGQDGPAAGMGLHIVPVGGNSGNSGGGAGASATGVEGGKRKGRPPGSGKRRQLDALGSPGTSFTPHIITVKPKEDVASKIMAFSQQGPRTMCIISANGTLGSVTLRQPATSGGVVTYEGRFEILSLSGSFLLAEDGNTRSRTGGLSVALTTQEGRVIGGCVAGMLMAATPVQVVVGSFLTEGGKKPPKEEAAPKQPAAAIPPQMVGFGAASAAASPPSDGTSSEHSDEPSSSPMGHNGSAAAFNNSGGNHLQSTYNPVAWPMAGNQARYEHD